MADEKATERRKAERRAADWRVLFGPPGDLAPGFLADLSPLGVCIVSEKQFAIGTEIEVHFGVLETESRGKLQMTAVVRHCGEGKIGVHFKNVDPGDREHWWKIMRSDF